MPSPATALINRFYEEIQDVRECGLGMDFEDLFKGIGCITAPVYDERDHHQLIWHHGALGRGAVAIPPRISGHQR